MSTQAGFAPLRVDTGEPVQLAMQRLWLTGQILPAGARLMVTHVFRSEEPHPLEVIYCFPLPRDAALRSFRITGDGFEAHSELKPVEEAVKAYERGIAEGALSTLARQYGDGLVNLTVGNLRPNETVTVHLEILCGIELRDDGFRFRFPFTLAPTYHPRTRVAVRAPGEGEMELPSAEFGDVIMPRFLEDASSLHQVGFELSLAGRLAIDEIGSPSHAVRVRQNVVALAPEKDLPNRDLVLVCRFQTVEPQVIAGRDSHGKNHFAAILPSTAFGEQTGAPRRVVILLDRSGSMQGEPLAQARKAIDACLAAISDTDLFGLVAFDNRPQAFRPALAPGTRAARDEAHDFLNQVRAGGGTELACGFQEAARLLDGQGGDILILTDGQVSGTEQILAEARRTGVRLHCLGIGSASQDRFLALLARETGGVSRFVTPRERVDLSAVDLFASIGRPVASNLKAGPDVQPAPSSFVFAGTPVLLFGEQDRLELDWDGGSLKLPVSFDSDGPGETIRLLQGSRLITDWESKYPAEAALQPLEKRRQNRVAARLAELSEAYGLASREMALVAVIKRAGDREGELPETRVVRVGMPQDTAFKAYFAHHSMMDAAMRTMATSVGPSAPPPPFAAMPVHATTAVKHGLFDRLGSIRSSHNSDDRLLDLAARIESDGGMPGSDRESRVNNTVLALLAFLSQGHTPSSGTFRMHVVRLVSFLQTISGLSNQHQQVVAAVIEAANRGTAPKGEWINLLGKRGQHWNEIERAVLHA